VADPHPNIDVYVNDQDISFFKVILEVSSSSSPPLVSSLARFSLIFRSQQGPKEDAEQCPYRGGCFLLTCDIPEGYPRDPPEVRFVTFIMHPNVSAKLSSFRSTSPISSLTSLTRMYVRRCQNRAKSASRSSVDSGLQISLLKKYSA
jgi:hypothetical protein